MLYKNILTPEELAALLDLDVDEVAKDTALRPQARSYETPELQQEVARLQRTVVDLMERVIRLEQQISRSEALPAAEAAAQHSHLQEPRRTSEAPVSRVERFGRKKPQNGKWFG